MGCVLGIKQLISNRFKLLSDFIEGLCAGVGQTFILLGIYAKNHDITEGYTNHN